MNPHKITRSEIILSCVEEAYYKDDFVVDEHAVIHMLSGESRMILGDRSQTFYAGDTIFLPRHRVVTAIKSPHDGQPYRSISLMLIGERLRDYFTRHAPIKGAAVERGISSYPVHPLLNSFFTSLLPYLELDGDLPEPIRALKIEECITVLRTLDPSVDRELTDFSGPGKIDLVPFMEQNFVHNLPTERFAFLTGRSLTTFKTDFKRAFHSSPGRWLTRKRLELAYRLINERNRRPSDVYLEVGFEDLSHFSYAFKKQYGVSPRGVTGS